MSVKAQKQSMLAHAAAISATAHQEQFDKAGNPYFLHPMRMMIRATTEDAQIVALLHDVVEDCPEWPVERLVAEGFSSDVMAALDCVTSRTGESYDDFLDRVLTNPVAIQVKLLDLEDNMNLTRLAEVSEKDLVRLEKYHRAYKRLKSSIE